ATSPRRGASAGPAPGRSRTVRSTAGHSRRGRWPSAAPLSGADHGRSGDRLGLDSGWLGLGARRLGVGPVPVGPATPPRYALGGAAVCLPRRPASLHARGLALRTSPV